MAVYTFTFPAVVSGLTVSVKNAAGEEVDTATAGTPAFLQGPVVITKDLPIGKYTAVATNAAALLTSTAPGVLDVPATLDDILSRLEAVESESA